MMAEVTQERSLATRKRRVVVSRLSLIVRINEQFDIEISICFSFHSCVVCSSSSRNCSDPALLSVSL